MNLEETKKLFYGPFFEHASRMGLSVSGAPTETGFLFHSAESRNAWANYMSGYTQSENDRAEKGGSLNDEINHPKHYELAPGVEAFDVIKATLTDDELRGYCLGNVLKYRLRAGMKDGQDAAKCLAKANWYRERLRAIGGAQIDPKSPETRMDAGDGVVTK